MTKEFKVGDKVRIVRSQVKSRNGLVGTITQKAYAPIYGPNTFWVEIPVPKRGDGTSTVMHVVEAEAMDQLFTKVSPEDKLAKIVELLEQIEATSDTTGVESEWLKGNYYGASNTAKAIRQILDA